MRQISILAGTLEYIDEHLDVRRVIIRHTSKFATFVVKSCDAFEDILACVLTEEVDQSKG